MARSIVVEENELNKKLRPTMTSEQVPVGTTGRTRSALKKGLELKNSDKNHFMVVSAESDADKIKKEKTGISNKSLKNVIPRPKEGSGEKGDIQNKVDGVINPDDKSDYYIRMNLRRDLKGDPSSTGSKSPIGGNIQKGKSKEQMKGLSQLRKKRSEGNN